MKGRADNLRDSVFRVRILKDQFQSY